MVVVSVPLKRNLLLQECVELIVTNVAVGSVWDMIKTGTCIVLDTSLYVFVEKGEGLKKS